jgi:hypothetical protein
MVVIFSGTAKAIMIFGIALLQTINSCSNKDKFPVYGKCHYETGRD